MLTKEYINIIAVYIQRESGYNSGVTFCIQNNIEDINKGASYTK